MGGRSGQWADGAVEGPGGGGAAAEGWLGVRGGAPVKVDRRDRGWRGERKGGRGREGKGPRQVKGGRDREEGGWEGEEGGKGAGSPAESGVAGSDGREGPIGALRGLAGPRG